MCSSDLANPNTKLDSETYALVRSNFQGDKETKEKAQASAATIQDRESITLASAKKRAAAKQEEEEPEIDPAELEEMRRKQAEEEEQARIAREAAEEAALIG